jgi:2-dehydropantoate 2-reductase
VHFIARGAHLEAMQKNGLQIKSIHGDFTIYPVQAVEYPSEIGLVDLVLFCVKTTGTDQAAQNLPPLLSSETILVSLQNGIDAAERLGAYIGKGHLLGGATWISSNIEAPGVIKQVSQFRRVVLGELNGEDTARLERVAQALSQTGITVETTANIQKVLWTKFIFIAAVSGIGSLVRLEIGGYRSVPETRAILVRLMQEVEAVARARGVSLDENVVEQTLDFIDKSAPHIKPSMQRDIEMSRPSELESMIGVIGREGRKVNIPTPTADMVYALLLPTDQKAARSR